ncbi:hypothetical protein M408DRAFT_10544 [Serendipita vermifera MAFF 305830]|uniref:Uncharacterized protein n=1 Tax=Serendipita vermifera MAFF 305830 TaxID=933852 RepID=A0A0C2X7C7_SERVB|nr:hypothetical protein M408DRAFT_10544 [Serendipita vermifera MAFF 305830]
MAAQGKARVLLAHAEGLLTARLRSDCVQFRLFSTELSLNIALFSARIQLGIRGLPLPLEDGEALEVLLVLLDDDQNQRGEKSLRQLVEQVGERQVQNQVDSGGVVLSQEQDALSDDQAQGNRKDEKNLRQAADQVGERQVPDQVGLEEVFQSRVDDELLLQGEVDEEEDVLWTDQLGEEQRQLRDEVYVNQVKQDEWQVQRE